MAGNYRITTQLDSSGVRQGRRQVEQELSALDRAAENTKGAIRDAFASAAIAGAVGQAVRLATEFGAKMDEISTLIDPAVVSMDELTQAALDQAKAFGSMPAQQAAAQYQIISAGATTAARATEILTASNKLAVGGVTDVATAADGLTSILNAYGPAAGSATDVSDAMFVAMRAGKTTIGELSANLGKVAPLAAASGVSFDELTAAIAALTKGGISTAESVTGVRAILAAVSKPTSEAAELAAKLGIQFNAAGVQALGFGGFMEQVIQKTGGSSEQLAILFGGVEALVPAMALAGQAGIDFTAIMESMKNKTGETDTAFEKISQGAGFQFQQLLSTVTVEAIKLGTMLLQALVPAMAFVNANFSTIVNLLLAGAAGWAAYRTAVLIAAAANTLMAGSFGALVTLSLSVGRSLGVAAGAQVFFAGVTGAATVATRGLTAAIIASPLAPLAIALTVAGAAYVYFSGTTQDATNATMAHAEAQAIAAQQSANRANIMAQLSGMTAQARAETIAYMKAVYASAQMDLFAAGAALQLAYARRGVLAAEAAAEAQQDPFSSGTSFGRVGNFFFGPGTEKRQKLAQVDKLIGEAEQSMFDGAVLVNRLGGLITEAENISPVVTPVVSAVPSAANTLKPNGGQADKPDSVRKVTFDQIEAGLQREVELSKLMGVEREVKLQQLQAEDQLERKLAPYEALRIKSLVEERAELEAKAAYQEQVIDNLDREYDVMQKTGVERAVYLEQLRAEDILGRKLTTTEANEIAMKVQQNEALADRQELLREIRGPMQDYIADLAVLNQALADGAITQAEYNSQLANSKFNTDLLGLEASLGGKVGESAQIEQARLEADAKRKIVDDAEAAGIRSAQEAADLRVLIAEDEARRIREIQMAQYQTATAAAADTFGSLASMAKDFAGEQSGVYKAMFAVSKAFAIADSIIKIQQAMAQALALPFPANIPAIAAVAAQAASIVSNIKAVTLAFADGGYVSGPGGPRSDSINARLSNGEFVVNAAATSRTRPILEAINSGRPIPATQAVIGGAPKMEVVINNLAPGVDISATQLSDERIEIVARRVVAEEAPRQVAGQINKPNSEVSKALGRSTTAGRKR